MKKLFAALSVVLACGAVQAQVSPVGLWKTIDDDGKTEKSLMRITESGGVVSGKIEKIFNPAKQNDVCEKCSDDRKDKPVLGLQVLRGLKQNADDKEVWDGGQVVDPENGKTYRAQVRPIEGGKKLQFRGYIGPFYRTQVWVRVE